MKGKCEEFTTSSSQIINGVCLFVGFFIVVGLMMAVSLALPLHSFKYLWFAKKWLLYEDFFLKDFNLQS